MRLDHEFAEEFRKYWMGTIAQRSTNCFVPSPTRPAKFRREGASLSTLFTEFATCSATFGLTVDGDRNSIGGSVVL